MSLPDIAIVVTVAATAIGAIITLLRYGPERRGILIREEEGSFNILNSLTRTLQDELKRQTEENERLLGRIDKLEAELSGLRRVAGRRQDDEVSPKDG